MMVIVRCTESQQAMELIDYFVDRGYDFGTDGELYIVFNDYFTHYKSRISRDGSYEGVTEITEFEDFKRQYMLEDKPEELMDFLKGYAR